ncbi:uncharacterized protein LOC128859142 [Anastrepha ludens]|uniref:uncharacterized protein LOC128859142 n=1 Tax=Anastrepha ludens TaxID=28586 RepID=UPI0023B1A845|nr:uncharacterized protein LOC128859142 [Anastrepha ludens]XP_053951869.1 uncharacterized protein LOC128859142 [Anastrepha ludens]XP_053951870.1 uncharacterized protein LOC128859142 [Anastrepha ludens]XP_053951871.1 uncharacterized protein LOC128859142 [Anastrepha ludens]XP_053951872.1 uncharacterized protein LOC128859142 [Anastrepha ludens]
MMEPAELHQQYKDYEQKVNEMQKLLPCLRQRIATATLQNENVEELRKLKLLQQVLCGQQAAGDSWTLKELDTYATMLKDAPNATNIVHEECNTASISGNDKDIDHIKENLGNLETAKNFSLSPKVNAGEKYGRETVENKQLLQEKYEIVNETGKKENENFERASEESITASESTENDIINKKLESLIRETENDEKVLQSSSATSDKQDLENDAGSEQIDDNSKFSKNETKASTTQNEIGNNKKVYLEEIGQKTDVHFSHVGKETISNFETPEDTEEMEYEGVELIKIPEGPAEDEMILPDSADEAEFSVDKSDREEEEQIGDEEMENLDCTENNENKAGEKYSENVDDGERHSDNTSPLEQEEITQGSDSNAKVMECTKELNENDTENVYDEDAHSLQPEIEENSEPHTGNNEENCSIPVEFAVEIDSRSGTATELEETTHCDDPLGQAESEHAAEIEADNSQQSSGETAATSVNLNTTNTTRTTPSVIAKPLTNDDHDDDDVEIIESRDSPICLDTDEENEKKIDDSAYDSTKVKKVNKESAAIGHQFNITTIKTAKSVTETIELLDSSDEDDVIRNNKSRIKRRINRQNLAPVATRTLNKMPAQPTTVGKKRTLLPAVQAQKPLKISQVLSGGAIPSACRAFISKTPSPSATAVKTPRSVLLFPPTSFKPTPQSNFLNAVNLLPATVTTGDNPLAFSATLSNKNIIIPNAFYANRRTTAKEEEKETTTSATSSASLSKNSKLQSLSVTQQQERIYREWLDEFIQNFASPQQIASHSCLVLMQSALRYKVFARIKDLRTTLNVNAYTSDGTTNGQLTRELYNAFYTNDCRLSVEGLRFCAGVCTQIGNNVTLMTDAHTGRITTRTCTYEDLLAKYGTANGGATTTDDKRKRQKGDEEYTPAKYYEKKVEKSSAGQGERRKSLRQHRTRCYDETFLYEPEEADDVATPTVEQAAAADKRRQDAQMMALVQRKAEEKRLEAKRQRQQQVKSFESAYLATFANTLHGKNVKGSTAATTNSESTTQNRSRISTNFANNHIVIDDEEEGSLEDDEPRSHRIYKVVPTRLLAAPKRAEGPVRAAEDVSGVKRGRPRKQSLKKFKQQPKTVEPELITCDSTSGDSTNAEDDLLFEPDSKAPRNININWHAGSSDWCKICNKRIPRTVSHYVNEHPDCEVYTSRIQKDVLARVRNQGGQLLEMRPYLNGQEQYAAECVFCSKTCCFKLPYWYQHYSMHTGEYAFRCSGCNIRKTTRSAMMGHIHLPCRKRGQLVEDYTYNARAKQIEMHICTLCNYMQLNRPNVLKHLRTQHGVVKIKTKHIESIILLRMPEPEMNKTREEMTEFMDLSSGGDESSSHMAMTFNYDNFDEACLDSMWDDGDPTDDLSYMICGMLDVEMRNDDE